MLVQFGLRWAREGRGGREEEGGEGGQGIREIWNTIRRMQSFGIDYSSHIVLLAKNLIVWLVTRKLYPGWARLGAFAVRTSRKGRDKNTDQTDKLN